MTQKQTDKTANPTQTTDCIAEVKNNMWYRLMSVGDEKQFLADYKDNRLVWCSEIFGTDVCWGIEVYSKSWVGFYLTSHLKLNIQLISNWVKLNTVNFSILHLYWKKCPVLAFTWYFEHIQRRKHWYLNNNFIGEFNSLKWNHLYNQSTIERAECAFNIDINTAVELRHDLAVIITAIIRYTKLVITWPCYCYRVSTN